MVRDWLSRYDSGFEHPDAELMRRKYRWLRNSQFSPPSEIRKYQWEQIRSVYNSARTHTRFYSNFYRNFPEELRDWDEFYSLPVLGRRHLTGPTQDRMLSWFPFGVFPASTYRTSGSTGSMVESVSTNVSDCFRTGLMIREMEWLDLNPGWSALFMRTLGTPDQPHFEQVRRGAVFEHWDSGLLPGMIRTGQGFYIDVSASASQVANLIHRAAPQMILGLPTMIGEAARLLPPDSPARESVQAVRIVGDSLSESDHRMIRETFTARVQNHYSCVETNVIATTAPDGDGFLVHDENVLVEILDEDDLPCPEGVPGRVVITALQPLATPFIRYDLGDEAAIEEPRGDYGLNRLSALIGRQLPLVLLPGGEKCHVGAVFKAIKPIKGIRENIARQSSESEITIILTINGNDIDRITKEVQATTNLVLGHDIRVNVEIVDELPRTSAGKIQKFAAIVGA